MKKKVGIIKRVLCIGLIFLLSINSFASIVSDNDGAAFITKAEFDALKSSFQSQIDSYNQSIDSKIDGAIASYLSGIKLANNIELENYLDKYSVPGTNGNLAFGPLNGVNNSRQWVFMNFNFVMMREGGAGLYHELNPSSYDNYTNVRSSAGGVKINYTFPYSISPRYRRATDGRIIGYYNYSFLMQGSAFRHLTNADTKVNGDPNRIGGTQDLLSVNPPSRNILEYAYMTDSASGSYFYWYAWNVFWKENYDDISGPCPLYQQSTADEWVNDDSITDVTENITWSKAPKHPTETLTSDLYLYGKTSTATKYKDLNGDEQRQYISSKDMGTLTVLPLNNAASPTRKGHYYVDAMQLVDNQNGIAMSNCHKMVCWNTKMRPDNLVFSQFQSVCNKNDSIGKGIALAQVSKPGTVKVDLTPSIDGYIFLWSSPSPDLTWNGVRANDTDTSWTTSATVYPASTAAHFTLNNVNANDVVWIVYIPTGTALGSLTIDSITEQVEN